MLKPLTSDKQERREIMNKKDQIITKLSELGGNVSGNAYLQGISQGIMGLLPIIIVGAFASLFQGLPIPFWQNFIAFTGINHLLNMVVLATTNMLGLYFVYNIARSLAKKLNVEGALIPVLAIVVYLMLLPETVMKGKNPVAFLSYDYLGTQGMIVAILLGIVIVKLYQVIINANLVVKMPEGTPDYVSKSFSALIPSFIIVAIAIFIRFLFKLTPYGNVFDCIYKLLQTPLTNLLGGSLLPMCILQLLTQVLWIFGIHPGFISSLTAPIMFSLDFKNQAAFAAGKTVPSIIGMAFSYSTTIAVLYAAFGLSVLIFARSDRMKTVGKISIIPAIFGISEPLIFGLPVLLNPIIALPWIICPIINFTLGYFLTSIGLVARYAGVTVFNFPMIATGLVNGSISIAIMEIGLCILDILIFMPFIRALDKKYQREQEESEQEA